MKQQVRVLRAIGCNFGIRKIRSIAQPFLISAITISLILVWLLQMSLWWLILALPLLFVITFGSSLLILSLLLLKRFNPAQSIGQQTATTDFVDTLELVSNGLQIPAFLLLYRITKNVISPQRDNFLVSLSHETVSLKSDFQQLKKLFDES